MEKNKKLIILTPSIIRGNFHIKSIGKFYELFYKYLIETYDIYHIINIDEPANLKKHFNRYETMAIYKSIIPEKINKIFISEPDPGFLQAWKKLISKVEELNLIDDSYLYYWLEDDWEPKNQYDITIFFKLFNFTNTAYTVTDSAPLGSFRGGPFMTGSYFSNVFNILKYMNNTCDPERQMQRWLRGGYQKNGKSFIHRLGVNNNNISSEIINIILVLNESNNQINLNELNLHHYKTGFDSSINFKYHLVTYDKCNPSQNLKYSSVNNTYEYDLKQIDIEELNILFCDNSIKYFILKPSIQFDIGRYFNKEYHLQKWTTLEDNTNYTNTYYHNAYLGNWKAMTIDELRLKPQYTMNEEFFSAIAYIHQCLPYLEKKYFDNNIKLNIEYYSHNYGSYPNFQVIGDLIQLNYEPTPNTSNKLDESGELNCLCGLCKKLCGNQINNEDVSNYYSYKDNFVLANEYFFKYLKFNKNIAIKTNEFSKQIDGKKTLGLHFRGTDKNKVKWVEHVSIEEFCEIIKYHLSKHSYDTIFVSTDDNKFIFKIVELFGSEYEILYYDDMKNQDNSNSIHLNRLDIMQNKIKNLKNYNNSEILADLELNIKTETEINKLLLENVIINSFILSKCTTVLKTHSQVSAYSKIFNPELEIYRVNGCQEGYWPDSHIPLYNFENVDNDEIKLLLKNKLSNEFDPNKKYLYKSFDDLII